jgi:hypothetical protein
MLKKITWVGIGFAAIIALFFWSAQWGYKHGYAAGSQATNNWWIEKKVKRFETSEIIKKRLNDRHLAI